MSVISRYFDALGVSSVRSTIRDMFGQHLIHLQEILPGYLQSFSESTRDYLGMSGREIAENITPFPYFSAFVKPSSRERALNVVLYGEERSVNSASGRGLMSAMTAMGRGRGILDRRFKYCPRCVEEDIAAALPPYWRVAHQLPGVVVCWHHQCVLRAVDCDHLYGVFSLDHALKLTSEDVFAVSPENCDSLVRIAVASRELLATRSSSPNAADQARVALLEAGVSDAPGRISSTKLSDILINAFGEKYLDYIGFRFREGPYPIRMRARRTRREPIDVLILREAVFQVNSRGKQIYIPKCPNEYALHGDGHPMNQAMLKPREKGISRWRCECGMSIEFQDADIGNPREYRILRYGPEYREKACQLLACSSIAEVASLMKVSASTIVRWSGGPPPGAKWTEDIPTLRREYDRVLAESGFEKTLSEIRLDNLRLFTRVLIRDREWQLSTNREYIRNRKKIHPRTPSTPVNWSQRDQDALVLLTIAAGCLATRVPPVRLDGYALRREAGIRIWSPDRMPLAVAYIHSVEESITDFYERAVYLSVCHLRSGGQAVTNSNIRELAGHRALTHVSQNNAQLLARLVQDDKSCWNVSFNHEQFSSFEEVLDRQYKTSIDWSLEDQKAVESLMLATARLVTKVPPIRLSNWAIRREAGLRNWSPIRMPLSTAYIRSVEESWSDFCSRAIYVVACDVHSRSQRVTRPAIAKIVGRRVFGYIRVHDPQLLDSLCSWQ